MKYSYLMYGAVKFPFCYVKYSVVVIGNVHKSWWNVQMQNYLNILYMTDFEHLFLKIKHTGHNLITDLYFKASIFTFI